LESQECAKRNLTFVAWDVIEGLDEEIVCVSSLLDIIDDFGFNTVPRNLADNTIDVEAIITMLKDRANIYNYPIDGIVFKFDNIIYGKTLGATAHHFNNAIAYKFYDDTYPTTLLDIEWSPGRTGVLTPVAIFEPVEIDGTTVQRASLHNVSVLKKILWGSGYGEETPLFDVIKNQKVEVFKANAINPQIASASIDHLNERERLLIIKMPDRCPICGKPTEIKINDDVEILYCTNPNCEAKLINQLDHFAGKKGLDIKGLSKATLEKLINWGWVEKIDDLFELKIHRAEWVKKAGFGAKSVDNILNAIEASKDCELHQFIAALGIPLIGTTASKALQKEFGSWSNFMDAVNTNYKFYTLEDFGDEKHLAIHQFNYDIANCIAENYLNFKEVSLEEESSNLEGLSFVITGKLKIAKNRDHLKTLIENAGGKVVGSVSKNTNYLINNDAESTSAKNKKAVELGVEVITETEFFEKFLKK
jgi:DNA ligase (NAD+)